MFLINNNYLLTHLKVQKDTNLLLKKILFKKYSNKTYQQFLCDYIIIKITITVLETQLKKYFLRLKVDNEKSKLKKVR